VYEENQPVNIPPIISVGQCTPTATLDIAIRIAEKNKNTRSFVFVLVKIRSETMVNIVVACPDGKEFLL